MTTSIQTLFQGSGLRSRLMRCGVGSIIVKLVHTSLTILVSVVLARALGASGYGVYAFVYALVTLLALPATMGLPQLVVRETAKAQSKGEWGLMRGLWRWSMCAALLFALVIAAMAFVIGFIARDGIDAARTDTLVFGLVMMPLIALAQIRNAAMLGLGRVVLGQLSESVFRPGLFIILLTATVAFGVGSIGPANAMALHAGAAAVALGAGTVLLWIYRPAEVKYQRTSSYNPRAWMVAATPLALIAGLNVVNGQADILLLGVFRPDAEVGIYRVVMQGAMLVAFGLQAVNMVVKPQFARLYIEGDSRKLQFLVTQSARAILALAVPVVLVYILAGRELLSAIFGDEYGVGYPALVILALGQLINAMVGSVGGLLNMTGYERDTMRAVGLAALINIFLNVLLIPQYGVIGAAFSTTASLAVWNLILWRVTRRRLGIQSTAINLDGLKRWFD